jgi:hypothetical protein
MAAESLLQRQQLASLLADVGGLLAGLTAGSDGGVGGCAAVDAALKAWWDAFGRLRQRADGVELQVAVAGGARGGGGSEGGLCGVGTAGRQRTHARVFSWMGGWLGGGVRTPPPLLPPPFRSPFWRW